MSCAGVPELECVRGATTSYEIERVFRDTIRRVHGVESIRLEGTSKDGGTMMGHYGTAISVREGVSQEIESRYREQINTKVGHKGNFCEVECAIAVMKGKVSIVRGSKNVVTCGFHLDGGDGRGGERGGAACQVDAGAGIEVPNTRWLTDRSDGGCDSDIRVGKHRIMVSGTLVIACNYNERLSFMCVGGSMRTPVRYVPCLATMHTRRDAGTGGGGVANFVAFLTYDRIRTMVAGFSGVPKVLALGALHSVSIDMCGSGTFVLALSSVAKRGRGTVL